MTNCALTPFRTTPVPSGGIIGCLVSGVIGKVVSARWAIIPLHLYLLQDRAPGVLPHLPSGLALHLHGQPLLLLLPLPRHPPPRPGRRPFQPSHCNLRHRDGSRWQQGHCHFSIHVPGGSSFWIFEQLLFSSLLGFSSPIFLGHFWAGSSTALFWDAFMLSFQ